MLRRDPSLAGIDRLDFSPILGIHLWYDRPVTDLPHAVLIDCRGQWVFNRGEVAPGEFYVQVVVSAVRELRGQGNDELRRQIVDELGRVFPAARAATLLRSKDSHAFT